MSKTTHTRLPKGMSRLSNVHIITTPLKNLVEDINIYLKNTGLEARVGGDLESTMVICTIDIFKIKYGFIEQTLKGPHEITAYIRGLEVFYEEL